VRAAPIIVAGIVGLLLVSVPLALQPPRGIRNNNPGNIRQSGTKWEGMSAAQTDSEFVQFVSPQYGIRAMAVILKNYRDRYGLNTVGEIINRWAPPHENDTAAYIETVARLSGLGNAQPVTTREYPRLIAAMIEVENGDNPFSDAQIAQGVMLA